MPKTKKLVKKSTKSAAKAKVQVLVNVNSNNRRKTTFTKTQPQPSTSGGPIYIPQFQSPNTNDGFHHLTNKLTESMANLLNIKAKSDEKPNPTPPHIIIHNHTPNPPTAPNANVAVKDNLPFQNPNPNLPNLVNNSHDIPNVKSEFLPITENRRTNWVDPAKAGPSITLADASSDTLADASSDTHHQVGYEGQDAGSYMRELAHHQKAVNQRMPPDQRHQHTPLGNLLLSPSPTRPPQRRHSGTFETLQTRRNVYGREI